MWVTHERLKLWAISSSHVLVRYLTISTLVTKIPVHHAHSTLAWNCQTHRESSSLPLRTVRVNSERTWSSWDNAQTWPPKLHLLTYQLDCLEHSPSPREPCYPQWHPSKNDIAHQCASSERDDPVLCQTDGTLTITSFFSNTQITNQSPKPKSFLHCLW